MRKLVPACLGSLALAAVMFCGSAEARPYVEWAIGLPGVVVIAPPVIGYPPSYYYYPGRPYGYRRYGHALAYGYGYRYGGWHLSPRGGWYDGRRHGR